MWGGRRGERGWRRKEQGEAGERRRNMGRSRREVRQFIRKRRWCVDFTGSEDDDIVLGGVEWYLQWC